MAKRETSHRRSVRSQQMDSKRVLSLRDWKLNTRNEKRFPQLCVSLYTCQRDNRTKVHLSRRYFLFPTRCKVSQVIADRDDATQRVARTTCLSHRREIQWIGKHGGRNSPAILRVDTRSMLPPDNGRSISNCRMKWLEFRTEDRAFLGILLVESTDEHQPVLPAWPTAVRP